MVNVCHVCTAWFLTHDVWKWTVMCVTLHATVQMNCKLFTLTVCTKCHIVVKSVHSLQYDVTGTVRIAIIGNSNLRSLFPPVHSQWSRLFPFESCTTFDAIFVKIRRTVPKLCNVVWIDRRLKIWEFSEFVSKKWLFVLKTHFGL